MNRSRRLFNSAFALVATGLVASAAPSLAYRMIQNTSNGRVTAGSAVACNASGGFAHWNLRSLKWYLNTSGQGSGKSTALANAMASWTAVANASHVLTYSGTTTSGWSTDNKNTILWASGNGCTNNCLALTALVLQSGQVIVETDITFNSNYTWNTNGSDYDVEAVAAHELGHTLGIHHTEVASSPLPTLYASYFGTAGRTLEADDRSAIQCSESRYPRKGMTWVKLSHTVAWGVDNVGCPDCNPYVGETSCATSLPILCIKTDGAPNPGISVNGYQGWIGGNIALTTPIRGDLIGSLANADELCASAHGTGWQMAEFHHSQGGWNWSSRGNIADGSRFWLYINDQPASCWN